MSELLSKITTLFNKEKLYGSHGRHSVRKAVLKENDNGQHRTDKVKDMLLW